MSESETGGRASNGNEGMQKESWKPKPWPKELMKRCVSVFGDDWKTMTDLELEQVAKERDPKIESMIKFFRAEQARNLVQGCSDQRMLLIALDLLEQVRFQDLEQFLHLCPRGENLMQVYAQFLRGSDRADVGTTMNKNFITFVLEGKAQEEI